MLPVVQKILRTLKNTEDATGQDATPNLYILCDMALAMATALANKQQPAKGKGSLSAAANYPGSVPLPSSFYKSLDLQTIGKACLTFEFYIFMDTVICLHDQDIP